MEHIKTESDKNPSVSIIIPVYNVERYLEQCIKSVLAQTYDDFEVILVNDGSTDGSGFICERYASKNDRIKYLTQDNGGASSARNIALRVAKGVFVTFVDSDDIISKDYLSDLITAQKRHDTDWTACSYKNYNNAPSAFRGNVTEWDKDVYISGEKVTKLLASKVLACPSGKRTLASSTCKLYRRSILVENDLFFDENLMTCEDQMFNLNYIRFIDSFCYLHKFLYKRNINEGSLFTGFRPNMLNEYKYLFGVYEKLVFKLGFVPIAQHQFLLEKIRECMNLYVFHKANNEDQKKVRKRFCECMNSEPLKRMWDEVDFMMYRGKRDKVQVMLIKSHMIWLWPFVK